MAHVMQTRIIHCHDLAVHAHPMQHDVHGVILRAVAGGGESVCDQRDAAGLRGQAVLQPHVRGHAVGQAAPVAAEPVRFRMPVKCLHCGKSLMQGKLNGSELCLQVSCVYEAESWHIMLRPTNMPTKP